METHVERIICPKCQALQAATVEHTEPFFSYVHFCPCGFTITESEWDRHPFDYPVLSVRQPWAWLIVHGWKNIENRTWRVAWRGRFLVHASKGMTVGDYQACKLFVAGFAPTLADLIPGRLNLERGGIVGAARILDCVERHESEWFTGPVGFVLGDASPMPLRPVVGRLGFFRLTNSELEACHGKVD